MGLYEITTGYVGCSYERCYVWASSRERAIELYKSQFKMREPQEVNLLVSDADSEFITALDDEGFGDRIDGGEHAGQ